MTVQTWFSFMNTCPMETCNRSYQVYICIDHSWSQVYYCQWKLLVDPNVNAFAAGREAADVLNWEERLQIAVDAAHGQQLSGSSTL